MFGLFSEADNDSESFDYDDEVTMSVLFKYILSLVFLFSTTELRTWILSVHLFLQF